MGGGKEGDEGGWGGGGQGGWMGGWGGKEGDEVTHHCVGHLLISNLFKLQSQLLPFSADGDAHIFLADGL